MSLFILYKSEISIIAIFAQWNPQIIPVTIFSCKKMNISLNVISMSDDIKHVYSQEIIYKVECKVQVPLAMCYLRLFFNKTDQIYQIIS